MAVSGKGVRSSISSSDIDAVLECKVTMIVVVLRVALAYNSAVIRMQYVPTQAYCISIRLIVSGWIV